MTLRNALLLALVPCSIFACSEPTADPPDLAEPAPEQPLAPDAIAVFDGGQITARELDQAILALSPAQRQSLTGETGEIYRDLVRELAVDKIFLREAQLVGADQTPEFEAQIRSLRRNAMVERFLRDHLPPLEEPTEAELRQAYAHRPDEYQRAERRLVYNLFRSLGPGVTKDDLRAELRDLREQVLAGQSFTRLAELHSDSESRHNQGILGWFERGQLAPQLEEVVFGLEEGVPSQPIATRDGVHLFYVDVVIEAKSFSFEDMRKNLINQHLAAQRREALAEIVESLEPPANLFVPTPDELKTFEERGDPAAVILRVGDFELRQGLFEAMIENDRNQNPQAVENRPLRLLETVYQAERIFQHLLALGQTLDAETEEHLRAQADRLMALQHRQQQLALAVDSDPESLRAFYRDNRRRFTSPLRLRLDRLSLPLDDRAATHMAKLERLRPELDAGSRTLEEIATELSAELETLDWMNLEQLGREEPKRMLFAGGLATGEHSAPYTTSSQIEMLRLRERQAPIPLEYEQVRGAVRAAYLERNLQHLYQDLRSQTLEEAKFRFLEDRFEALLQSGLHPTEP